MNFFLAHLLILFLRIDLCLGIEKRAFVTVVTTEGDVESAMAMGSSLRAMTRSSDSVHHKLYSIDYICLFLQKGDVSNEEMRGGEGVSLLGMKKLVFAGWTPKPVSYSISNQNSENLKWKERDFNCIWLWSLSEYDKIVYISTTTLIIQDVKELFEKEIHFGAAPQIFSSHKFDSSLMVIRPDMSTFTEMTSSVIKSGVDKSWHFNDFVNEFFSDWYSMNPNHRLAPIYNAPYQWTQNESWEKYRSLIKAVHFHEKETPSMILREPDKFAITKFGAPLIYVWAILLFFIANPLGDGLEDETRYVLMKIFDVTKSSEIVAKYMEKMKRGGTRLRIGIHDSNEL